MTTTYHLNISIATGYERGKGWTFKDKPDVQKVFTDALSCNEAFEKDAPDIVMLGSQNECAARIQIIRVESNEVIRQQLFDGEHVYFWVAAIQGTGKTEFEDRWYITHVTVPVGYYTLMHPDNQYPNTKTVACAATLYELKEMLGDEFHAYENRC